MPKENEEVRIIYSNELAKMRLMNLVSQRGIVTKVKPNGKTPGVFVLIHAGKSAGEEWFVPMQSVQTKGDLDRIRNFGMLKSVKL